MFILSICGYTWWSDLGIQIFWADMPPPPVPRDPKPFNVDDHEIVEHQLSSGRRRGSTARQRSVAMSAKAASQLKRIAVSAMPKTVLSARPSLHQRSVKINQSTVMSSAPAPAKQKLQSAWYKPSVQRLPRPESRAYDSWKSYARVPPMEDYEFYKITVSNNGEGKYKFSESNERYTIKIAADWKDGLCYYGSDNQEHWSTGYLGSGFSKDAIYASIILICYQTSAHSKL